MTGRDVRSVEDLLALLDGLFVDTPKWQDFYGDRDRPVPFFAAKPDENLVSYLERGLVSPGRALDLGCGPGRNALHLAAAGFSVDAVDLSPAAIEWARERAGEAEVRFLCGDAFTLELGEYDFVYDSGCFHHLPPHRRVSYLSLLDRCLKPGGHLGLACFAAGSMGSVVPDTELYRRGRLEGGLGYSEDSLRWIFEDLTEIELRRMTSEPADSPHYGVPFLWTALFQRT
ncbi:class I SAM-dependent methyltransferase [Actinophytocola algeriensis]|uniref:SAM-dependent methyltransferase n=1 Tax=Actinophytocola algeriensis TaxID=1768010 RepID=A0A7W7Q4P6_9PSEU|nr:class I SAM-dependent methyltransferase [Actinophytocola algeriensis]MBB4906773.1 SAM-dependent methyltransferase [Actinophytocola algeriensis]MBE1478254.1 SAM-dependent methyltransferase [Actinophytocola algeriensis]